MEKNEQRIFSASSIFDSGFMSGKTLFMYCFNMLPSANQIDNIDGEKAYDAIRKKFAEQVSSVHTWRHYDAKLKGYDFNETYLIMKNNSILEFDTNYCEIYHDGTQPEFIEECTVLATGFKKRQRRKPMEINMIAKGRNGLLLKAMEIKHNKLNLDLYYEDDFKEVDILIRKRLNRENDKGIVLLHGIPGTGKTTYLRHLVSKIKKRVLFLSTSVAANIMDPDFIELLMNNPNCVLVIEDAENIIMDRKAGDNPSVSNLLNISDGLLADFLNVQIICTFNSALTLVDNALLRQGRLIARYEFKKLSVAKSQRLSDHLGFKEFVSQPMTIAEIANPREKRSEPEGREITGFRRASILEN